MIIDYYNNTAPPAGAVVFPEWVVAQQPPDPSTLIETVYITGSTSDADFAATGTLDQEHG